MPRIDTGVRIDVEGDQVSVRGPSVRLKGIFDVLKYTEYTEAGGIIVTTHICDPIPNAQRQLANGAIYRARLQ